MRFTAIVSVVRSNESTAETVIYECRRCGKSLESADSACPYCGPTDIAEFHLE